MSSITSSDTREPRTSAQRHLFSEPDTSRAWWFLGTLAVLRNPEGAPRTPAVIELTVPPGGSPPRHVHEVLDDAFLVLDGEVVVRCGEQTIVGPAGHLRVRAERRRTHLPGDQSRSGPDAAGSQR